MRVASGNVSKKKKRKKQETQIKALSLLYSYRHYQEPDILQTDLVKSCDTVILTTGRLVKESYLEITTAESAVCRASSGAVS